MSAALVVAFVASLAAVTGRILGAALGVCWERARGAGAVHPWAGAAPGLAAGIPPASLVIAALALVPSVPWTWLGGACACATYGGLHVCPLHLHAGLVAVLAVLGAGALTAGLAEPLRLALRLRDLRHLTSHGEEAGGVTHLDCGGSATVFVAGLRRPRIFVDRAWWAALPARDRSVIEAHERAHVDARDPWTRATLEPLLGVFAPGLRERMVGDWLLAAELTADRRAADADGDPLYVAEALCRYARSAAPAGTLALGGDALAARVGALLDGWEPAPGPRRRWALAVAPALALLAHGLHRLLEAVLVLAP